jgi:ribosomal-protein-alanine N-acetyltransferase
MVIEKAADIRIEQMRVEDVEEVAELDKKCFPTPWSAGAYMNEVNNHSAYYVVARVDHRIISFAGMWLIMDEAHITTIGVDPEFRGQKIGERILIHILDEAVHQGARRVTLEVRKSNSVAQNLYDKYMFHTVAVRKAYYTNNDEDALVMWIDDMWSSDFLKTLRKRKDELGILA